MALSCPTCEVGAAEYVGMADDGRNEMRCTSCGHHWLLGARPVSPRAVVPRPAAARPAGRTTTRVRSAAAGAEAGRTAPEPPARAAPAPPRRMPTLDDVPADALSGLMRLKAAFRRERPAPDPYAAEFRSLYALVFSEQGLQHVEPQMLKGFVTSTTLGHPGNTSVFVREWNRLGDRDAARRTADAVEYLLRGDPAAPGSDQEARFTALGDPKFPLAVPGLRESLLTKVLCVVEPERFVPVLHYSSPDGTGKRELARAVLDLELPPPDRGQQASGPLVLGSNDLLVDALGAGFADLDDAATFLLWAADRRAGDRT